MRLIPRRMPIGLRLLAVAIREVAAAFDGRLTGLGDAPLDPIKAHRLV
jgi:hypothetical protein